MSDLLVNEETVVQIRVTEDAHQLRVVENPTTISVTDFDTIRIDNAITEVDTHIANTGNPHAVTKTQVGLGNVDDVQQMPLSYLSTTVSLGNSNTLVPSQNAVRTYTNTVAIALSYVLGGV